MNILVPICIISPKMNFKVNLDLDESVGDDGSVSETNGIITIEITCAHIPKIKWVLSDCACYPSTDWINFLGNIKGCSTTCKNVGVGGGGNSNWNLSIENLSIENSMIVLDFNISGCGGDSNVELYFSFEEMIPIIEKIIDYLKIMEQKY